MTTLADISEQAEDNLTFFGESEFPSNVDDLFRQMLAVFKAGFRDLPWLELDAPRAETADTVSVTGNRVTSYSLGSSIRVDQGGARTAGKVTQVQYNAAADRTYITADIDMTGVGRLWANVVPNIVNEPVIPAGTIAIFAQAEAPAGWEKLTDFDDAVLMVSNTAGGTVAGSWTIGATVKGTALTEAQLPEHAHYMVRSSEVDRDGDVAIKINKEYAIACAADGDGPRDYDLMAAGATQVADSGLTSVVGESEEHTHELTWPADWRPMHLKVIVCRKL